jgi:nucleolar protein 53
VEEEGTKDADKGRDVHERMKQARQLGVVTLEGLPSGMALHEVEEEEEQVTVVPLVKPAPTRKTKQQRKKAQRALEEVRPFSPIPGTRFSRPTINVPYIEKGFS